MAIRYDMNALVICLAIGCGKIAIELIVNALCLEKNWKEKKNFINKYIYFFYI